MCDCRLATDSEWTYDNQEQWKTYKNYYSVYKTPININTNNVLTNSNKISIHYSSTQLTHSEPSNKYVQYNCLDNSSYVIYDGLKYTLIQFHFHNSSENTKDGKYYPVECHMVHSYYDEVNLKTKILVIGLLMKVTKTNGSNLTHNLTENYDKDVIFDLSPYNNLIENKYYQFLGGLTIPPFYPNNILFNLFFNDDITNDVNLNILEKDYLNFLNYYSNCKTNYLSYVNDNRQAVPLSQNFLSVTSISPN
jgi:carbonic anhydrase